MSVFEKWLQLFQSHARVGLTISDYSIRMVLSHGTSNDAAHLDYWEEWLSPGIVENGRVKDEEAFTAHLKDMVHALKAKGKRTYFAIPDSQLILRQFDFPGIKSDPELQNYFFIEIGNKIQLPFEQAVFDFHVISRAATGTKVLLIAAPEAIVTQYRKLQGNAGLNPVNAEFSALGTERWVRQNYPQYSDKQRMYVQLEKEALYVSIFDQEIPMFVRQVSLKGVDQEVAQEAFALNAATEIERMLNFYQYSVRKGTDEVTAIYLLGDTEQSDQLKETLSAMVTQDVNTLYFDRERLQDSDSMSTAFIPVIGLALKEGMK
ncbi:pilus assembly protein PilM [Sporolactobacillus kofuensis]|nr:pilus assembly protein PilM [Sporolactobacillus kofuensis]MCO7175616.1 pilus assembly protein PilM [Sporolactobacillus kofuensis]